MKPTQKQKRESNKRYYRKHKEEHSEWSKAYYLEHKDEYKARSQQYYQENKAELKEKHKRYYEIQKAKERNKKQDTLLEIINAIPSIDENESEHIFISDEQIADIEDKLLEALDVMSAKTKYRDLCVELIQKAELVFKFHRSLIDI